MYESGILFIGYIIKLKEEKPIDDWHPSLKTESLLLEPSRTKKEGEADESDESFSK
ncbi:hypothetical protein [Lederbergia citrea]|uniref:hypothetical protein n=1 Tax=Lederbergia citrea TaxID=2833581 RepID=UPI001BC9D82B|nr:hypothetical protein [Lederbergia citrea]MBS4177721.1 hypothetical protein [Lederbergia citrea]